MEASRQRDRSERRGRGGGDPEKNKATRQERDGNHKAAKGPQNEPKAPNKPKRHPKTTSRQDRGGGGKRLPKRHSRWNPVPRSSRGSIERTNYQQHQKKKIIRTIRNCMPLWAYASVSSAQYQKKACPTVDTTPMRTPPLSQATQTESLSPEVNP